MDTAKPPKPNFLRRFFAKNFIDLRDLPLSLKLLTIAGYLAVLGMLLFTLLIERFGVEHLPMVTYTIATQTSQVPLIIVAIAGLAFIMGWVYLLTGAASAKARIFLPVLALFFIQLFMVSSFVSFLLELLFFFVVLAIYAFTFRLNFWRDLPMLHFFGWLAATSIIFFLSVGTSATNAAVGSALSSNYAMVMLLTLMFWILLSFSLFDLGLKIGRFFTRFARKFLPFPTFNALVVFVILIHPAVALLVIILGRDPMWSFDLPVSILILLGALIVRICHRWSPSIASVFLAISLAAPVVMISLSWAFAGVDLTAIILKSTGLFPPTLLFVAMTTYNLLDMGVKFTAVDGKVLPKRSRVLLYFGTLILVIACMLFVSNEYIAGTDQLATDYQDLINTLVALGAYVLVIPYAIWMIWKRRELLTGPEKDFAAPPRWPWLTRIPTAAWIAIAIILACGCGCLLAGISGLLVYPSPPTF